MKHDARGGPGDEGAAAVEFALVSLLLVSLLLGVIAFGFALFQQQSVLHAAREGARLAATGVNDCPSFRTAVASRAKGAGVDQADVSFAIVPDAANGIAGTNMRVDVTIQYDIHLEMLGFLGFGTMSGSQTGRARVERLGTVVATCP